MKVRRTHIAQARSVAAALVLVAVAVSSCSLDLFVGGIGRDQAIHLARQQVGADAVLLSADAGPLSRFTDPGMLPEEPRDRQVWGVRFRAVMDFSCPIGENGPAPGCLGPKPAVVTVVLDRFNGEVIFSSAEG